MPTIHSDNEKHDFGSRLRALNELFKTRNPQFFQHLEQETRSSESFPDLIALNTLRKRSLKAGFSLVAGGSLRLAIVGGCTLRPLADLIEHLASVLGNLSVELWLGEYDNYIAEIMDKGSALYDFKPELVLLLPSEQRCAYPGLLSDPRERQRSYAESVVQELLSLCKHIEEKSGSEIILGNYRLPPDFGAGPLRYSSLGSEYNLKKWINLELGLGPPQSVHLCDIEFLSNRLGTSLSADRKGWFESKQPFSVELMVEVAREIAHIIASRRKAPKKVLILDLDNTLWGGVIGDDGIEGIELGTTSPRGEAFRQFQLYLKSLAARGVLLAVCSKNELSVAMEPFEKHPEMALRLSDIVSFKANWEPKSDNIRQIALDLNLTLDSLVFVDDNPAEIDIVRQHLPEVSAIWLEDDPAQFPVKLDASRLFEQRSLTHEDLNRTEQYKQESLRQGLLASTTDLDAYLASLEMRATVAEFSAFDIPRISQLINKSNQFNLTTKRRTEAEVRAVMQDPRYATFTIRLSDKFGDLGIICIVICKSESTVFEIDTWLMSCRVLKRQVENEARNEIVRLATERGCHCIVGTYLPTSKNGMVSAFYPLMGFDLVEATEGRSTYHLIVDQNLPLLPSRISVCRGSHEPIRSY